MLLLSNRSVSAFRHFLTACVIRALGESTVCCENYCVLRLMGNTNARASDVKNSGVVGKF